MLAYVRFVIRHRVLVLAVCLFVTVLAGVSASRVVLASSLPEAILGSSPEYARYVERVRAFSNDEQLVVAYETPAGLTGPERERLTHIAAALERSPMVRAVESAADPLGRDLMMSGDGRHTALVIEFTPDGSRTLERAPAIVDELVEVFVQAGIAREDLHLGGLVAVLAEVQTQMILNVTRLTPIVAIVLLIATYVLFRRLWPVLVAMMVGGLAIVWTLGFAILLDRDLNVLIAICPSLILIIAFSDVVHLSSAYLTEVTNGRPRDEAIVTCAAEVGRACVYTSLTTFLGFVCISLIDSPAFRLLGLVLAFGVAVALLLAMTLVPILFSYIRTPKPWRHSGADAAPTVLDRSLHAMRTVATRRPWPVIAAFGVLLAGSVYGTSRISVETDLVGRMSEGNRLRRDMTYFERHFGGALVLDVFLTRRDPSATFDADTIPKLEAFHDEVAAHPAVGRVLSVVDIVRAARAEGDDLLSFAARPDVELRGVVDSEGRELRFAVIPRETGVHAVYELGGAIRAMADRHFGDTVIAEPTGLLYLAGAWLEANIIRQAGTVVVSVVAIGIVMIVLFRSFSVGLWSMLPNAIPLLAVGGVLGLGWEYVDSDAVIVALVAIGIAVDDTIHFLTRYRTERARGADVGAALEATYTFSGRAIVITSVIFALAFAPFAFSDYLSIRLLGIALPIVMIVALAADLLLLPSLIAVGAIRMRVTESG